MGGTVGIVWKETWILLWRQIQELFCCYRVSTFLLRLKKCVSASTKQGAESLYFWDVTLCRLKHYQSILSFLSLWHVAPLPSPGNQNGSHADISLRFISCYFFTGASGLTMQGLFPHNWKEFVIMCRDVSHDEVLDCFQLQQPLMLVLQSPFLSSLPGTCLTTSFTPFSEWFLITVFSFLLLTDRSPLKYTFWGSPCS